MLSGFGDRVANNVTIGRDAAGKLLVNNGAVPIFGGTATVANTSLIQLYGLGGDDIITLDKSKGALPRANLFGGADNDVLTAGSGADLLFGHFRLNPGPRAAPAGAARAEPAATPRRRLAASAGT